MLSYALYFFSCFYILVSFFSLYFLSFLGFFLLSMSFIIHFSLSFHILLFYNFFTLISYVDYYIQFHFLTCSIMTSSSIFNSLNSHFFIFFIPFWYSICYSSPLLTHFSHPFHLLLFYKLLTSLPCIDCYIQFHFLTRSIMTSSSFFNSFNCPFFIFLCLVLVLKLLFISLAYSL